MNARSWKLAAALLLAPVLAAAAESSGSAVVTERLSDLQNMLEDAEKTVNESYMPASKVDRAFAKRCRETESSLAKAQSLNEAYALISDTLCALDPRIRFFPPNRAMQVDYGWQWELIGDGAYVDQVDRAGAARQQGLQLGDRVLAIEGVPVGRDNYQQIYYLFRDLGPLPGLRVLAQSPGAEPRLLAIEATLRERPPIRQYQGRNLFMMERARTPNDEKRRKEFFDPATHVRRVAGVGYWNAAELHLDPLAVGGVLKRLEGAESLIIDLRGQYIFEHEAVIRALESLFSRDLELGRIDKDGLDTHLRVAGRKEAFPGTVVVLVDAETACYAELLAHVVQHEGRGVIVGDRTMGRVFEQRAVQRSTGNSRSYQNTLVVVPAGEIVLADGTQLDGHGVIPDYQVLPKPADLAAHRDVVLSKAFTLLKQKVPPEDAYAFRPHYGDEDDEY